MPEILQTVKVELMKATWTLNGGSAVVLGPTKEGSKIVAKRPVTEVKVMELGDSPVNLVGRGWDVSVELALAASTLDNLAVALATVKTSVTGPPAKYSVDLDPRAGIVLPFGKLVLHPISAGSDLTRDWTIWRAQVEPDLEANYVAGDNLVWPLKFRATVYEDASTNKVKIATFGDVTAAVDYDAGLI